jgi:hypothetical protein
VLAVRTALAFGLLALVSCGGEFTSTGGDPDGGLDDASPQGSKDAATPDRASPIDSPINPNATIACSTAPCEPGPETCCMQNSNDLPDFCVGGPNQPAQCTSDKATVTVIACDDAEDCAKAGKPGTVCCAEARTFDIDPNLPVWARIRCVAPANCVAPDDDVFCGSNQADCPPGKTCTKKLGPYTYCE